MWYWDFTPQASGRFKKASRKQIEKMKESFARADELEKQAKKLEAEHKENIEWKIDEMIDEIL